MKIIECPRDAMQGIEKFIPTERKIEYINQLLKIGFDTIDFGSFVSPKAIPQLKDTANVLNGLDLQCSFSKLLAIIANLRGANDACAFQQIDYLGFPLSVSEEFQKRNTNIGISQALKIVEEIQDVSLKNNKQLVVYLSMAFGNPYNEAYHQDLVLELVDKLHLLQITTIALSDTIGISNTNSISQLFSVLTNEYSSIEFGAHFHTTVNSWKEKVYAAYTNGCKRFDSALRGYGGCPMADDNLVGNMPTEKITAYFNNECNLNEEELAKALILSESIFI